MLRQLWIALVILCALESVVGTTKSDFQSLTAGADCSKADQDAFDAQEPDLKDGEDIPDAVSSKWGDRHVCGKGLECESSTSKCVKNSAPATTQTNTTQSINGTSLCDRFTRYCGPKNATQGDEKDKLYLGGANESVFSAFTLLASIAFSLMY